MNRAAATVAAAAAAADDDDDDNDDQFCARLGCQWTSAIVWCNPHLQYNCCWPGTCYFCSLSLLLADSVSLHYLLL